MDKGWFYGFLFVRDGKVYCGYGGVGLVVLDVEDLIRLRCLGELLFMFVFFSRFVGVRIYIVLLLLGRDLVVV